MSSPTQNAESTVWVTMPCKGRLAFVQQSLPRVLAQPGVNCCVVDYSCPDGCGDWLEQNYSKEISEKRLVVERVPGKRFFHKAASHNVGARRVLREGAEHIVFLDADTLLNPGWVEWLLPRLCVRRFWIAGLTCDGTESRGLVGFLVVPRSSLEASEGFDERFEDWGGEDLEFRLRLAVGHHLDYGEVPVRLMSYLPHSNALRTRFYRVKQHEASNFRNHVFMSHQLRRRYGLELRQLDPTLTRLWRHLGKGSSHPLEVQ